MSHSHHLQEKDDQFCLWIQMCDQKKRVGSIVQYQTVDKAYKPNNNEHPAYKFILQLVSLPKYKKL